MGQDLDDLDNQNHDLKQQEHDLDGLLPDDDYADSPDGIENVDISDIQNMINKSSESPVDQEMLEGMNFMHHIEDDHHGASSGIDFYNKKGVRGAAPAMDDDEYYDQEDQENFDDLDSEQMMKMIEGHNNNDDFNHMMLG